MSQLRLFERGKYLNFTSLGSKAALADSERVQGLGLSLQYRLPSLKVHVCTLPPPTASYSMGTHCCESIFHIARAS